MARRAGSRTDRHTPLSKDRVLRAAVSIAVHWIRKCPNPRQATMSGFFDSMDAKESRKAFSLVTTCHPSWLPQS